MKDKKIHKFKLDKINLSIFKSIQDTGKINYSKIGKEYNLSHVSIKNRFENLLKKKIIQPQILVNFSKFDYKLGILLLEADTKAMKKLQNIYQNCPRLILFFSIIGEYNYGMIFFAEDLLTLETMLNSCMLYNIEGVRKSNIMLFGEELHDQYLPIRWHLFDNITEDTPCGTSCKYCKSFMQEKCLGCPASKNYRGPLKDLG